MTELQVTENAEKALGAILDAFETPEELPEKLSKVWLNTGDRYCSRWSDRNQLLVFLFGHTDAATYKTWQRRGRQVRKGSEAFPILKPIIKKYPSDQEIYDDGEPTGETQRVWIQYLAGFEAWPVFGIKDTDVENEDLWSEFEPEDTTEFLDSLPWLALADKWKLDVIADNHGGAYGWYEHGKRIGLSVRDTQTWAHEMVHAAEDRLGNLTKARGQQPDNELVAELGACVLMQLAGLEAERDLAWTWEYISAYDGDPRKTAFLLLGRICKAVSLIINESEMGGQE